MKSFVDFGASGEEPKISLESMCILNKESLPVKIQ